ncbi:hypothetical protein [Streptococcus himalayensis]|uniref:hypothetical protein n=1 Tax=Streptococcus himalayensis TaxID=1888195 RepID=UPI0011AB3F0D|nr:hypothetical protein [Streptococcus himalayensis]
MGVATRRDHRVYLELSSRGVSDKKTLACYHPSEKSSLPVSMHAFGFYLLCEFTAKSLEIVVDFPVTLSFFTVSSVLVVFLECEELSSFQTASSQGVRQKNWIFEHFRKKTQTCL